MSADAISSPQDEPSPDDEPEAELEDLATLDVEATADEVMTAVHWIEDHTPGLGKDSHPASQPSAAAAPAKRARRRPAVASVQRV